MTPEPLIGEARRLLAPVIWLGVVLLIIVLGAFAVGTLPVCGGTDNCGECEVYDCEMHDLHGDINATTAERCDTPNDANDNLLAFAESHPAKYNHA